MSKIINSKYDGYIIVKYDVEPTLATDNEFTPTTWFVTQVEVTTYWDGDTSVSVKAVPVTKNGKPNKARTPVHIWLDRRVEDTLLADLGIDTTALPLIRSLANGPQDEEE